VTLLISLFSVYGFDFAGEKPAATDETIEVSRSAVGCPKFIEIFRVFLVS